MITESALTCVRRLGDSHHPLWFIAFEFAGRGGTVKPQPGRGVSRFPPKLQIEQITTVEVLSDRLIELAPHQSRER